MLGCLKCKYENCIFIRERLISIGISGIKEHSLFMGGGGGANKGAIDVSANKLSGAKFQCKPLEGGQNFSPQLSSSFTTVGIFL